MDLSAAGEPTVQLINDGLRGGLAYTAAMGETCQVASAVDAVREAVRHLSAGHPGHASTALEKALEFLAEPVFQPVRSGNPSSGRPRWTSR
jgi:hypothetical protein